MKTASETQGRSAAQGLAAGGVFFAMLVAALSLWTAIPLGWIYIGSKVSRLELLDGIATCSGGSSRSAPRPWSAITPWRGSEAGEGRTRRLCVKMSITVAR